MLASHSAHRTQGLILHRKVALAGPRPLVEKCLDGSGGEQLVQTSLQHRRQGPSVDSSTWFPLQTGMRSQTMNDGPAVARQGSLSPLQFSAGPGNYLCFLGGAMAFGMSKILNWPRLERLFSQSIAWQLLTMDNLWAGSMSRPGPVHLYVLSRLLAKVSPTRVILSGLSLGNVAATGCVQVTEVAISHSIRALVLWDHVILPGYTLKPVRLVNCSGTTTKPCLYPEFSTPPCRLQAPGILIRCSWYEHETIDAVNDYVYAMQSFGAVTFEGLRQACLQDTSHISIRSGSWHTVLSVWCGVSLKSDPLFFVTASFPKSSKAVLLLPMAGQPAQNLLARPVGTYRDDLWDITRVLNFAAG